MKTIMQILVAIALLPIGVCPPNRDSSDDCDYSDPKKPNKNSTDHFPMSPRDIQSRGFADAPKATDVARKLVIGQADAHATTILHP